MNFKSFGAPSLEAEKSFSFGELNQLIGNQLFQVRDLLLVEANPEREAAIAALWQELLANAQTLEQNLAQGGYAFQNINEEALSAFLIKIRENKAADPSKAAVTLLLQAYMRIEQA